MMFAIRLLIHTLIPLLQIGHAVAAVGLAIYGFNALWLTWQWRRRDRDPHPLPDGPQPDAWPEVMVQLPIYNEYHVVTRLLDACAQLDYPRDRLQIQVLDDSTDETTTAARLRAAHWRQRGVQVEVLHREERQGFKAGALAQGLSQAKGTFVAIFDADFVPPPDFLRRTIPLLIQPENQRVAFVQARWGHLNPGYSWLTRCQALALDGHFVVEQAGRQAAGYPFGFNGSAGVWRRACLEDPRVGGWQADTLCEDLDLSYRAQMAGWQGRFLAQVVAPGEIPPQLLAFKRQQFRWAKGSVQVLRKLAPRLWRMPWPLARRLQGLVHLGSYLIHPLLLLLLIISLPLLLSGTDPFWPLAYLSLASVGPPLLYALAQRQLHGRDWWRRWAYLPLLTFLGMGLSFSNSLAVWQALSNRSTPFQRTPKFQVRRPGESWQRSLYAVPLDPTVWGELALCGYALLTAGVAVTRGQLWSVPFLLLYASGYGLMVLTGLWQAWQAHPHRGERAWLPKRIPSQAGSRSRPVELGASASHPQPPQG